VIYKQSGIGREYSPFGYQEFLEIKSTHRPHFHEREAQ
jgi:acyl-CoA reductase-like NAD-dependent aldehyde dehydrogenase